MLLPSRPLLECTLLGGFFLLMFLIGFLMLIMLGVKPCLELWALREGVSAEARVTNVDYELVGRGRKTRLRTLATFEYAFEGKTYESDRVSLYGYTGNFYKPLRSAMEEGRKVPVFLNPGNPSKAVHDRTFHIWPTILVPIMGFVFLGVGFAGLRTWVPNHFKQVSHYWERDEVTASVGKELCLSRLRSLRRRI